MHQTFPCPNCNSLNYIGQPFCGGCGQKLLYSCPNCGSGVDATFSNCLNCRSALNWPAQQSVPLHTGRSSYREGELDKRYYEAPGKKRTRPVLVAFLSTLVVMATLIGGTILSINMFGQETLPTSPVEAMPPPEAIQSVASSSNLDKKALKMTNMATASVTDTSVVVTWTTDEPATSQVEYGTTGDYGLVTILDKDLVINHNITVANLEPSATYYVRAKSKNAGGYESKHEANQTVTTLARIDATPPVISAIKASNISQSSCIVTWATDEPATGQVEYGKTTAYGSITGSNKKLVTNQSVTITGLEQNTIYYFKIRSEDAGGNAASSANDKEFRTIAATQETPLNPPTRTNSASCH